MKENKEGLRKEFQNEVLKVFLLMHLNRREGYPYALLKELKVKRIWILHGLTKNDLYNTIKSLENRGFIRSKPTMAGAVNQKYYVLTQKGKNIVKNSKKTMIHAFKEVIKMMEAS